jgi:hypothetical protein
MGFEGIKKFLIRTAMALRRGDINPTLGNCLINAANALMRCEELIQLQRTLDHLLEQRTRTPLSDVLDVINAPGEIKPPDDLC